MSGISVLAEKQRVCRVHGCQVIDSRGLFIVKDIIEKVQVKSRADCSKVEILSN